MNASCAIFAALGLSALVGVAQAQTLGMVPVSRSTETGAATVIGVGRHWNTSPCVPQRTAIVITQPPVHGNLRIVDVMTQVPQTTPRGVNTGYCAGMVLFGKKIIYQPAPGFEGTDTMSYESVGPDGRSAPYTVTVSVTPHY